MCACAGSVQSLRLLWYFVYKGAANLLSSQIQETHEHYTAIKDVGKGVHVSLPELESGVVVYIYFPDIGTDNLYP